MFEPNLENVSSSDDTDIDSIYNPVSSDDESEFDSFSDTSNSLEVLSTTSLDQPFKQSEPKKRGRPSRKSKEGEVQTQIQNELSMSSANKSTLLDHFESSKVKAKTTTKGSTSRSVVWSFFDKVSIGPNANDYKAVCKYCSFTYERPPNTTNLSRHLKLHPEQNGKF